jgi:uncharacterized protein YbjT (DUF2867 family)
MNLLVLGASGKTGTEVVKQAPAASHNVIALVRDPAKAGDAGTSFASSPQRASLTVHGVGARAAALTA